MYALSYFSYYLITNPTIFSLFKWTANLFVFAGAAAISLSPDYSQQAWPFALADFGSVLWLWAATIMRDRALIAFQVFFVFVQTGAILLRLNN